MGTSESFVLEENAIDEPQYEEPRKFSSTGRDNSMVYIDDIGICSMNLCFNLVITGYTRQNISFNKLQLNSTSIITLIDTVANYLGSNNFIQFDILPNMYCTVNHEKINENITFQMQRHDIIKTSNVKCMVGCSKGWNKGIHDIIIKCIVPGNDTFGITTDIDECTNPQWIKIALRNTYLFGPKGYIPNQLQVKSESDDEKNIEQKQKDKLWNVNDLLRLHVDCNDWIVKLYVNEVKMAKNVAIENDCCYHLVFVSSTQDAKYELIDQKYHD
eukprot:435469_1